MKCPVCSNVDLLMAERHGVEIDYCSSCRGIWLDRGELDKVIERANAQLVEPAASGAESDYRRPEPLPYRVEEGRVDYRHHRDQGYGQGKPYKKKKSLLAEIFDFD